MGLTKFDSSPRHDEEPEPEPDEDGDTPPPDAPSLVALVSPPLSPLSHAPTATPLRALLLAAASVPRLAIASPKKAGDAREGDALSSARAALRGGAPPLAGPVLLQPVRARAALEPQRAIPTGPQPNSLHPTSQTNSTPLLATEIQIKLKPTKLRRLSRKRVSN